MAQERGEICLFERLTINHDSLILFEEEIHSSCFSSLRNKYEISFDLSIYQARTKRVT